MLNVKQTLKNLHKKLPTLSLDDLFEVLDCYVEYDNNTIDWLNYKRVPTWEPGKIWYSTNDTTGVNETPAINCITSKKADPEIYTVNPNLPHGKIKYYDGGGSIQLAAEH